MLARLIAWRLHGVVIGLLRGTPDTGPGQVRIKTAPGIGVHRYRYAVHLGSLTPPHGGAPILLQKVAKADRDAMHAEATNAEALHLPHPVRSSVTGRCKEFRYSLSRHVRRQNGNPERNFNLKGFLATPTAYTHVQIVQRVRQAMQACHVVTNGPHDFGYYSPRATAALQSLLP